MQGEFERGRELHTRAAPDVHVTPAWRRPRPAWRCRRAGSSGARATSTRGSASCVRRLADLETLNDRAFYSTVAACLAQCLYVQGRFDEAESLCVDRTRGDRPRTTSSTSSLRMPRRLSSCPSRVGRGGARARTSARSRRADTTDIDFARAGRDSSSPKRRRSPGIARGSGRCGRRGARAPSTRRATSPRPHGARERLDDARRRACLIAVGGRC